MTMSSSTTPLRDVEENSEQYDTWEAGDLQSDIYKLRSAVALLSADTDLSKKEGIHLLDQCAKNKRELIPDVQKFVFGPASLAIILLMCSSLFKNNYCLHHSSRAILSLMNIAYYMSLGFPLVTYLFTKLSRKSKKGKNMLSNQVWNPDYIDPTSDCSDYSLCLIENWMSSILPSAILQCMVLYSLFFHNNIIARSQQEVWALSIFQLGKALSRLVTRLGAAASLHQFPKLLYDLRRSNQPRPIQFLPTFLKKSIDIFLWILPVGIAADITQLCLTSTRNLTWSSYFCNNVIRHCHQSGSNLFMNIMNVSLILSILVPIAHIWAIKRIVRIGYFTNLSLATERDKLEEILNDPQKTNIKLRYRLQWREPVRLFVSFKHRFRDLLLFIFTGWGERSSIVDDTFSTTEPYILTLVRKEMERNSGNSNLSTQPPNRSTWIPNASERIAKIHQENYERQTFDDPLGIAFQQTFGVGLSLDFDHDTKLSKDEEPSVHRLRARAAKSLIKSYNSIPGEMKKQVKCIEDDKQREIEYMRMVQEERDEVVRTARELLTLLPTNAPAPEGKDLDIWSMRQSEASKFDLVSLPWLKDDEGKGNNEDDFVEDPYLSLEDAFMHDFNRKRQILPDFEDDKDQDIFNKTTTKTILT